MLPSPARTVAGRAESWAHNHTSHTSVARRSVSHPSVSRPSVESHSQQSDLRGSCSQAGSGEHATGSEPDTRVNFAPLLLKTLSCSPLPLSPLAHFPSSLSWSPSPAEQNPFVGSPEIYVVTNHSKSRAMRALVRNSFLDAFPGLRWSGGQTTLLLPKQANGWESRRTMPLVGGFSRGYPVSPALAFLRFSFFTPFQHNRLSRTRATVAERLACSPPSKANRAHSPAGSLRIYTIGNFARRYCWSAGLLEDLPFPPSLHSIAAPFSTHFTLTGSQDLAVKSRPNVSTKL
ncbi:hypothetical protein PR048_014177 [Dryococelus australis]|uniref:Uncharacterized protein n=1 Tax=Dryococelus australis TaxID=614101 RepID=A0ABQ9HDJ0_9NEOP|nr:hypothetical protein PR048_014177 [Dryococelus australis]